MATTEFGVGHPMAVKLWSKKLYNEAIAASWISKFIGTGKESIISKKTETSKSAGDQVTFGLRVRMTGNGVSGDNTLEGNEEALTVYTDAVLINQLRHATRSAGKMSEQRVPFDVRQEGMEGLRDWWSERLDLAFANQIAGNTVQSDVRFTGMNATVAPDTNHIMRPATCTDGAETSLSTTDTMTLAKIDAARARAMTYWQSNLSNIRPIKIDGEDYYAVFMHPDQVEDLRVNTNTGQWLDIQKAAMSGGKVASNPIFTGALGVYNKCVLHEWSRLPAAINASGTAVASTRRAVFCGAQAASLAVGRGGGDLSMEWNEELFDYGNQLGIGTALIWGLKKTVFNSVDFATIVIPTYAAAN